MKYLIRCIFYALLLGTVGHTAYSDSLNDMELEFDSMLNDPALDLLPTAPDTTRIPPQQVIDIIQQINGVALLQQNLYLRTNPINTRSIIYYPFVQPPRLSYDYNYIFGGHMFYNQTNRAFFTQGSSDISSYLAICQTDFLDLLSESAQRIRELLPNFTISPLDILPLFNQATVEERRIGGLLYGSYRFKRVGLRAILPAYYLERNYIIPLANREKLEAELGATTDDEQKNYQRKHLVSDKFGLGDTRIEFDVAIIDREDVAVNMGLYTTLPTAVAFGTGGLGSKFEPICMRPEFDFENLLAPAAGGPNSTQILQNFFIGTLDQLSANLLEAPLGNGGHFGLGAYIENDFALSNLVARPWARELCWVNKTYLEYMFPCNKQRFFIKKANPAAFAARNFIDPNQADFNLAFLNQQVVDRFYPFVYNVLVHPGYQFEWISKFSYEARNGGISVGNDIWAAGKEKLTDIKSNGQSLANIDQSAAVRPTAFQSKIFGTVFLKANRETRLWLVSFNGDYTYMSRGIGKDFTATLGLEINF